MTNLISPHPNPPYLKSDGSLNASGQLKLYIAGTSTPKVAYSDAAGTSYGSTINLNSSGLPESGPIYFANDVLYKVEVYTRTDDVPTYALDYTVDNFGEVPSSLGVSFISADTTWTVDGVGAGADEYATLAAALTASKDYTIVGDSVLTISIDNGTYANETSLDFNHANASNIKIVGESEAGVIFTNTAGSTDWITLGSYDDAQATRHYFENITFDYNSSSAAGTVIFNCVGPEVIFNNCTFDIGANAKAMDVSDGARLIGSDLTFQTDSAAAGSATRFLQVYSFAACTLGGTTTFDHNLTNGTFECVYISNQGRIGIGSYVITAIAGATVTGFTADAGILEVGSSSATATVTNVDTLYKRIRSGVVGVKITGYLDGTGNSTYTSVTTPYAENATGNGFQTGVRLDLGANQTVTDAYTDLTFATETWDIGGDYSDPNFTAPISGRYLVHCQAYITALTDADSTTISVLNNGTIDINYSDTVKGTAVYLLTSGVMEVAKGNVIKAQVINNTASRGTLQDAEASTYMTIEYLGS